ncbi:MAG: hypothetical protein AAF611_05385 [Bacteroidota bacterium]
MKKRKEVKFNLKKENVSSLSVAQQNEIKGAWGSFQKTGCYWSCAHNYTRCNNNGC